MKKHPRKSVSNHKKTCDDGLILNKRSQKLLGKLLADYKKLTSELRNLELSDSVYLDKLFEAISIFPIIWYGIIDPRTEDSLRDKFVYVRDRDTVFVNSFKRERIQRSSTLDV